MNPTKELYNAMQVLYDHFNANLFNHALPAVLFTNQRQTGIMGYFSPNRWAATDGKKCHEIAINPVYVGRASLIELMQTLVHEMVHCWQECYGKPSRKAYHNRQWSNKMISLGLMPSSSGSPGGSLVGQRMGDYPIPKGKFIHSCEVLLKKQNFRLPWVDRFAVNVNRAKDENQLQLALGILSENSPILAAISEITDVLTVKQLTTSIEISFGENAFAEPDPNARFKIKSKYNCPICDINVWGKPGLRLNCADCDFRLRES